MELLAEIFTQETNWDRTNFLQTRPNKNTPLALLRLGYPAKPIEIPVNGDTISIDPEDYAAEAALRLRQTYPGFTTQVARETGLIDLYIWQNQISWWWFLPFSEKSSLRTPLIEWLYWFCILEIILEEQQVDTIHIITDNADYGYVLRALCQQYHVGLGKLCFPAQSSNHNFKLVLNFLHWYLRTSLSRGLKWVVLKLLHLDSLNNTKKIGSNCVLFCSSLYPSSFEQKDDSGHLLKEIYFGTWPRFLEEKGYSVAYAASIVHRLSLKKIISQFGLLRQHVIHNNLFILESLWSFSDLLKITFNLTFFWRYWWWRQHQSGSPILFHDIDVHRLVLRELDYDVFCNHEVQHDVGICYALKKLIRNLEGICCVSHTFEYQPRERAYAIGIKMSGKNIPTVGFQTSMFTFQHLPWAFPKEETQQFQANSFDGRLAPLPDYVVAYGQTACEVFQQRFIPDTVILAGPIRYAQLVHDVQADIDVKDFCQSHNIPHDSTLFFLAGSIVRSETIRLIQMTLKALATLPEAYLLVKFHPHLPLQGALKQIADKNGFFKYQIFDANLNTLLKISTGVISGSSSVGVDGIALDCMPIALSRPGNYEVNRLRDFPEAAFFCQNEAELKNAMRECINKGPLYQQCKSHWPRVIESLLYRLDGRENDRLYEALKNKGVL